MQILFINLLGGPLPILRTPTNIPYNLAHLGVTTSQFGAKMAEIVALYPNFNHDLHVTLTVNQLLPMLSNHPSATLRISSPDFPVKPFFAAERLPNPADLKDAKEIIDSWARSGIIVLAPDETPWLSNLVFVRQKDKLRVCINSKNLNARLPIFEENYLPKIWDHIHRLSGFSSLTKLDLEKSYLQFPLFKDDMPLTAFKFLGVKWMFTRIPFGIHSAPHHVNAFISDLMQDEFTFVYIDDIIFKSDDNSQDQVIKKITKLNQVGLKLNLKKCEFFKDSINVLGHIISKQGISVDPARINNLANMELPKTAKQLMKLLGRLAYIRNFNLNFSDLLEPFYRLIKVKGNIRWHKDLLDAFNRLKKFISSHNLSLAPINFDAPFFLITDASNVATASVLAQKINNTLCPIMCDSKTLNKSQQIYSATQKELLGVLHGLEKFEQFLLGRRFTILTDHKSLVEILNNPFRNSSLKNFTRHNMFDRWIEFIQNFSFTVDYLSGENNVIADHLSRSIKFSSENFKNSPQDSSSAPSSAPSSSTYQLNALTIAQPSVTSSPVDFDLLVKTHVQIGHGGPNAIVDFLSDRKIFWKKIRSHAKQVVRNCKECNMYNIFPILGSSAKSISANSIMEHLIIDLTSPPLPSNGYTQILTVVDVYSSFGFTRVLRSKDADEVASALLDIFCSFGFPKILQSDQGLEFNNELLKEACSRFKIDKRLSNVYRPSTNGLVEKFNGDLKRILYKLISSKPNEWSSFLPFATLAHNLAISRRLKYSAFEIFFGRKGNVLSDYSALTSNVEELTVKDIDTYFQNLDSFNKLVRSKAKYNSDQYQKSIRNSMDKKKRSRIKVTPGSYVLVENFNPSNKFSPRYHKVGKVINISKNGSYIIQHFNGERKSYNIDQIRPVTEKVANEMKYLDIVDIISHKQVNNILKYSVRNKFNEILEVNEEVIDPELILDYWTHIQEKDTDDYQDDDTDASTIQPSIQQSRPTRQTKSTYNPNYSYY